MNNEIQQLIPMMLYGLIILVFAMGVALAFISVSYRKIIEKLSTYEEQERKALMRANSQALEIVKKAQQQASGIIEGSGNLVKYNNSLLEKDLKIVSEKELVAYQQALDSLKKQTLEIAKNITKDVNSVASEEFSEVVKQYKLTLEKSFERMLAEVEEYKKLKKEEIDKNILEIVNETTLSVVNKSLNQHEHTELVIKALEEAKKKHVF